jgi:hypothetical protein
MFKNKEPLILKPRKENEPIKKNRLEGDVKNFGGRKVNVPKPKIKRT